MDPMASHGLLPSPKESQGEVVEETASPGRYRAFLWLLWGGIGAVWGLSAVRVGAYLTGWLPGYGAFGLLLGVLCGLVVALGLSWWWRSSSAKTGLTPVWGILPLALPLIDLVAPDGLQPWRSLALLAGGLALSLIGRCSCPRWAWAAMSAVIPLVVYVTDVSPYVGRADTFEFQVIGPTLGLAHPSGYPLYTLICKLFSLLPFGTVAWRVNLSSALAASLASTFLYLALAAQIERQDRRLRLLALLSSMALAFSPTLWSRAVEAEVYALNACLTALVLWVVVRWHTGELPKARAWAVSGLLLGLALASHLTLGGLAPMLAIGLLVPALRPPRRAWAWAVPLGLAGLLLYAYIPLRWPAVTGGEAMSFSAFVRYVLNTGSGGALHPLAFYQDPGRWVVVWRVLRGQLGMVGLGLAAFGWATMMWQRKSRALAVGTLLTAATWVWFALSFYVADPDYSAFLIPLDVLLVFWLGRGVITLARTGIAASALGRAITISLVALLPLKEIWTTGPGLDVISQGKADEAWGRYVLHLPLSRGAAILADSEKFPPLYYLQQIEGQRPDLELVTLFSEDQYREAMVTRLNHGQVVYLARYLPGMDAFGVSSVGPLVVVTPSLTCRDLAPMKGVAFGTDLRLASYELAADPLGRPVHHVTLTWCVITQVEQDLEVRFRIVGQSSEDVVWEWTAGRPVAGYTTTASWKPGQRVDDYHEISWPAWIPAGEYRLDVGLFPRFSKEGLAVEASGTPWYSLGPVSLSARSPSLYPERLDVQIGHAAWLLGGDVPAMGVAGGEIEIDLIWRCQDRLDGVPQVQWVEQDSGVPVMSMPLRALGEAADRGLCEAGSRFPLQRRYRLEAPSETGEYRLELVWEGSGEESTGLWMRCHWLGHRTTTCPLEVVTFTPSFEGLANYDNRIALLDADFDARDVAAGGTLRLVVWWKAMAPMEQDYTVFVQVLGPDGQLYGQVDSWPVQGTYPTSTWNVGDVIADHYEFFVSRDGPTGDYRLIIGWYLLSDMSRLPLLDADGAPMGDFFEVGRFTLP